MCVSDGSCVSDEFTRKAGCAGGCARRAFGWRGAYSELEVSASMSIVGKRMNKIGSVRFPD